MTWPNATVQTCVVHLVRNSLRYASKKYWGQIARSLRQIYTAPTVEAVEARFGEFAAEWRALYPAMIRSWENAWEEFVPFLEFPVELLRIVYTTNAIESLNARFRRAVRHRGHFPNGPLPRRHHQTPQPREPDRQDQQLDASTEHPDHPLRRQTRRHAVASQTSHNQQVIYTKNLTDLSSFDERGARLQPHCALLSGCDVDGVTVAGGVGVVGLSGEDFGEEGEVTD